MDERTGLCIGCYRTLEEIARWGAAGNAEKRAILAAITERRASPPLCKRGANKS